VWPVQSVEENDRRQLGNTSDFTRSKAAFQEATHPDKVLIPMLDAEIFPFLCSGSFLLVVFAELLQVSLFFILRPKFTLGFWAWLGLLFQRLTLVLLSIPFCHTALILLPQPLRILAVLSPWITYLLQGLTLVPLLLPFGLAPLVPLLQLPKLTAAFLPTTTLGTHEFCRPIQEPWMKLVYRFSLPALGA
jgi:hypothetical protein